MKRSLHIIIILNILFVSKVLGQDYSIKLRNSNFENVKTKSDSKISSIEFNRVDKYFIIQFNSVPNEKERDLLNRSGIELLEYIPNYAYIARKSDSKAKFSSESDLSVIRLSKFKPDYKLDYRIFDKNIPSWAIPSLGKIKVVITGFETIDFNNKEFESIEITDIKHLGANVYEIVIDEDQINQLASVEIIKSIELVKSEKLLHNKNLRTLHRANVVNSDLSLGYGLYGEGVTIGEFDGGAVYKHEDLRSNLTIHTNLGYSDHATHVAGTIIGKGLIDPEIKGVAPKAQLHSWDFYMDNTALATDTAIYEQNLNLVTNSWGYKFSAYNCYDPKPYGYTDQEYDKLAIKYPKVLQIFSVGNDREQCSGGYKTAGWNMKNVLYVGAVDNNDKLGEFSSCGPLIDGRIVPHVVGLGVEVYSTELYNKYMYMDGTSMSTPGVTGSIALLYEAYKKKFGEFPESSLAKAVVCNTATDLGNIGPDYQFGFGRIDILKAIESIENETFFTKSINQNSANEHIIELTNDARELKVTLVWIDKQAYQGSSIVLVDNLDLTIEAPEGEIITPFILDPENPSKPAEKGVDNLNNIEQIVIKDAKSGVYKIKVKGSQVQSRSSYSLAYNIQEDNIQIIYPIGQEKFISGKKEFIRWNNSDTSTPVDIYLSVNNGITWDQIANDIDGWISSYEFEMPEIISDKCKIKIQQGDLSTVSDTFSISSVPTLIDVQSNFESGVITWRKMENATSYNIYKISNGEIRLAETVTDTFYSANELETNDIYYYSVSANFENVIGQRNIAELIVPIPGTDLAIKTVVNPLGGAKLTDEENVIIRLINNGAKTLVNGTRIYAKYILNGGIPVEDTITLSEDIERDQTFDYTFSKKAYLALEKIYTFQFEVNYEKDSVNTSNNELEWKLLHSEEVDEYPYKETFDMISSLMLKTVWDHVYLGRGWVNNYQTDDFEWWPWNSDTYKDGTGPSEDHTSGNGKYLYTESFFLDGEPGSFELFSPYFNLNSLTKPVVSFWYHMYAESLEMGSLHVDLYSVNEDNWYNDVVVVSGSQGDTWKNKLIDISDFKNKGLIKLRFRVLSSSSYQNAIAIDDFELYEGDIYDLKIDSIGINEKGGLLTTEETFKIYYSNIGGREISIGEKLNFRYTLNNDIIISEDLVLVEPFYPGEKSYYEFESTADLSDITVRNIMDFEIRFLKDSKISNNKITSVPVQSYTEPEAGCQVGYYFLGLYNFTLEGNYEETSIENSATLCANTEVPGYSFYGEKLAGVYRGESYGIGAQPIPFAALQGLHPLGQYVKSWIDYNQNGLFETDEEIFEIDYRGIAYHVDTIKIPHNAVLGKTRLRIRTSYFREDLIGEGAADRTFDYGETEDYTIEIKDKPLINVGLSEFVNHPVTFSNLSENESLRINVVNTGFVDINISSELKFSYSINDNLITESYTLSDGFSQGESFNYDFNKKLDLSAVGKYVIKSWVDYEGDVDKLNDTLFLTVINLPEQNINEYYEDFESSEYAKWYATSTKNREVWQLGEPGTTYLNEAHSGNTCWGTVLDNVYLPRTESILYSPVFDFTKTDVATVSFWLSSVAEPNYDGMVLETSTDGITWIKIGDDIDNFYNSDYKGPHNLGTMFWSDYSEGWKKKELDVYHICGYKAAFRFRFISDENLVFEGFTLDDFKIDAVITSVDDLTTNNLKIYPNPFANTLNIELKENLNNGKIYLKVIDMTGVTRYEIQKELNNNMLNINLENLESGIYTLQLITETEKYSKQIIKN